MCDIKTDGPFLKTREAAEITNDFLERNAVSVTA
jgi:hypothetical protein